MALGALQGVGEEGLADGIGDVVEPLLDPCLFLLARDVELRGGDVRFGRGQRGAGVSFQNTLDYAASNKWLLRSWSIGVVEEEVAGLSWTSKLIGYRTLSLKSAMSYPVYGVGETDFEVPIKDYGFELRYRRQIAREWLFIELLGRLNWPREFLEEVRESNWGVGIEFELQFGNWPGRNRDPEAAQEARMRLRESESTLRPVVSNRAGMPGDRRAAGTSP